MQTGMAVYDWDENLIGYTRWDSESVRKYYKKADGVIGRDGNLSARGTREMCVKPEMVDRVFATCGRYEAIDSNAATQKQLDYLAALGVNVTRKLTKREASEIIDAVKRGDGVGQFGMFMFDGSN